MAIELIAKIKPKNNGSFPMADAVDVEMPDGLRVPEAVAKKLDKSGWSANKLLVTDNDGAVVETDIPEIPEAGLPESGWAPNKYLGTDSDGNVVEKDAPTGGGGLTEVSWEDIQDKPFYEESVTSLVSFDPLPSVTFDGAGYTWWKCSDLVLTREQILKTTILLNPTPEESFVETPKEENILFDNEYFTMVRLEKSGVSCLFFRAAGEHTLDNGEMSVTFNVPETGVYLGIEQGITPPTTISVGIGYRDVKTLDAKYLPMDAIDERIGAYIEEALGGDY